MTEVLRDAIEQPGQTEVEVVERVVDEGAAREGGVEVGEPFFGDESAEQSRLGEDDAGDLASGLVRAVGVASFDEGAEPRMPAYLHHDGTRTGATRRVR